VEIDFQAMMIRLIAAPDSGQKGGEKLITASPSTNHDPVEYLCISTGAESTFKHTRV
jgi:hypothetical protein